MGFPSQKTGSNLITAISQINIAKPQETCFKCLRSSGVEWFRGYEWNDVYNSLSPVSGQNTLRIKDIPGGRSILGNRVSKKGQNGSFVRKKVGSNLITAVLKINITRNQES